MIMSVSLMEAEIDNLTKNWESWSNRVTPSL